MIYVMASFTIIYYAATITLLAIMLFIDGKHFAITLYYDPKNLLFSFTCELGNSEIDIFFLKLNKVNLPNNFITLHCLLSRENRIFKLCST